MGRLLLTGGGTAGHVTPHLALIEYLETIDVDLEVFYIGSHTGLEKELVSKKAVPYYAVTTGKWHRAWRLKNLWVPFQLIQGIIESVFFCLRWKPSIVLSKGGFVALPVVIAAWLLGIPVLVHESDVIPGLANRISFPLAKRICYAFTLNLPARYRHKIQHTGIAIREELLQGNKEQGLDLLHFTANKPMLLIWGGSLGAAALNSSITRLLPDLLKTFQVVHLLGSRQQTVKNSEHKNYRAFTYLDTEPLAKVLAAADLVISRAGATAIYELLMLRKPHILCPLSTKNSRGEQIENARYTEKLGLSSVIYPEQYTDENLLKMVLHVFERLPQWQESLRQYPVKSGTALLYQELMTIKPM